MIDEKETPGASGDDDELSQAFDEYSGKTGEEGNIADEAGTAKKEPEGADEGEGEPLTHEESSKLGRKVKGLTAQVEMLKKELETRKASPGSAGDEDSAVDDEEELNRIRDLYTTDPVEAKREQDKYEVNKAGKSRIAYEKSYLGVVGNLAKDNEEFHEDILSLMTSNNYVNPYNTIHTGDPRADAMINYAEAKAAVFAERVKTGGKTKIPVKGSDPAGPAGSSIQEGNKSVTLPPLDEYAADYANYLRKQGYTNEDIAKALK